MRFRFGGALGMTRVLLRSCGLGSGNTLIWKSTSVRTLLATVQGLDVAYLSPLEMKLQKKEEKREEKK